MEKEENRRVTFVLSGTENDLCKLFGEIIIQSIGSAVCGRDI